MGGKDDGNVVPMAGRKPGASPKPPRKVASGPDWLQALYDSGQLEVTQEGKPQAKSQKNARLLIEHGSWLNCLEWDIHAVRLRVIKPLPFSPYEVNAATPREWNDNDDLGLREWLCNHGVTPTLELVPRLIAASVQTHRSVYPVRAYLDSLVWDGVTRLEHWLIDHFNAADTVYTRAVSKRWLISAVARTYQPGCKADVMLILEGKEGLLKSTALAILAGAWFTDDHGELGTKDSIALLRSQWIVEIGELSGLTKKEAEFIKTHLSKRVDRCRDPFARRDRDWPRRFVWAGTTNSAHYLVETHNRRFWPVKCLERLDAAKLEAARDQLWAEAVHLYRNKEPWFLTPEEEKLAKEETAEREIERPYVDALRSLLEQPTVINQGYVTMTEATAHLGLLGAQQSQAVLTNIGKALSELGCERYGRPRKYRLPDKPPSPF
mgnify:CR=1 FL=1